MLAVYVEFDASVANVAGVQVFFCIIELDFECIRPSLAVWSKLRW